MHATYLIPESNADRFLARLTKLDKAAAKCGTVLEYAEARRLHWPHPDAKRREAGELLSLRAVTVRGETPSLNGWAFMATLQHLGDATILRSVNGEALPEKYRTASPDDCDHCHKLRLRKDTYVVRHENGTHRQVGKSCLRDFLGHRDPHAIARLATQLADLTSSAAGEWDEGERYGREETVLGLAEYLSTVAAAIDQDGWTSRTIARDEPDREATADWAWHHHGPCLSAKCLARHVSPTERHKDEAETAAAWASTIDPANDYLHNVRAVAAAGIVTWRLAGIAASIVPAYRREIGRELERKRTSQTSAHVGTVGKRQDFELTLAYTTSWEGNYGVTRLYKFHDAEGNILVWFASRDQELAQGDAVKLKGTIKKHDTRDGAAQTILTRCKVLP